MSAMEHSVGDRSEVWDRTLDSLLVARESAEDETARVYSRLEQELKDRQAESEAASSRELESARNEARLRAHILELERKLTESELSSETSRADALSAHNAKLNTTAQLTAKVQILEHQLTKANDLSEMYQNTVKDLEEELTKTHASTSLSGQQPVDPSAQIYTQELQEAILENTRLEQQLSRAQSTIQELKVTELVNESLVSDKQRLRAELEILRGIEAENSRIAAKLTGMERQSRQWAAFIEVSDEYTNPQQLTRQLAELQTHVAALKRMLSTSQQVIEIQRSASKEASVLGERIESQKQQLAEAEDREAKLQLQVDAGKMRLKLMESHLDDSKTPPDSSELKSLEDRLEALLVLTPSKRPLNPASTTVDNLDKLATKLLDAEQRAQDANQQLAMVEKELESVKALSASNDRVPAAVMEIKGSPQDQIVQGKLELLESLERENDALKKQIETGRSGTVPLESIAVLNTRLETTKRDADTKYQGLDQLLKGFRTKVLQTKCAERSVFGYELELRNNSTCLVRSEYALDGIDKLLEPSLNFFEFIYDPIKKRYTDLSYTSSVHPYEDVYRYWIQEREFLPGFLAAVLLQNYEKYA